MKCIYSRNKRNLPTSSNNGNYDLQDRDCRFYLRSNNNSLIKDRKISERKCNSHRFVSSEIFFLPFSASP